jgi:multiple sugar transport system permease protein
VPGSAIDGVARDLTPLPSDRLCTGSLPAVLPLIGAFVLLQRFWRSGLTAGAVK